MKIRAEIQTISFFKAIHALQIGNRIRRKDKIRGYTKILILEGKNQIEKFGSYYKNDSKIDYSSTDDLFFTLEDVLAEDWIIDD